MRYYSSYEKKESGCCGLDSRLWLAPWDMTESSGSSGSGSRGRSAPASILAFLQNQDDSRIVRIPAENSTISGSTFKVDSSPPNRPATSSTSFTTNPTSLPTSSTHGSIAGLTFGTGTSYTSSASITTSHGVSKLRVFALPDPPREGHLDLPPLPLIKKYECPFDRLSCLETFTSFEPWYDHSLTHFRHHDPPIKNFCCFCPETFTKKNGIRSWKVRLDHVKLHHDRGEQLATSRFDPELYRYLWRKGLVSDIAYKDLTGGASSMGKY